MCHRVRSLTKSLLVSKPEAELRRRQTFSHFLCRELRPAALPPLLWPQPAAAAAAVRGCFFFLCFTSGWLWTAATLCPELRPAALPPWQVAVQLHWIGGAAGCGVRCQHAEHNSDSSSSSHFFISVRFPSSRMDLVSFLCFGDAFVALCFFYTVVFIVFKSEAAAFTLIYKNVSSPLSILSASCSQQAIWLRSLFHFIFFFCSTL